MEYFNHEKLKPLDKMVSELYDFSKVGAVAIPNVLKDEVMEDILIGLEEHKDMFIKAQRVKGPVVQDMEQLYIERKDEANLGFFLRGLISGLRNEYGEIHKKIGKLAGFQKNFNFIGFNHYKKGSAGISPHQDFASDINLTSIFVLKGNTPFYANNNRSKEGAVKLDSNPGTLILLRAARTEQDYSDVPYYCVDEEYEFGEKLIEKEQLARPFHYLDHVREDRYSMMFRTTTE